ncbi:MAG TPA: hypothetical protein VFS15_23875 [Kofleriaceae bacterium]|nr:hypothetical protein [Kofleriaceae bacterium]
MDENLAGKFSEACVARGGRLRGVHRRGGAAGAELSGGSERGRGMLAESFALTAIGRRTMLEP